MLEITGRTVKVAVPDLTPTRAVIVTVVGVDPALTLVANPEEELIVAAEVLLLAHVKVTPVIATLYDVWAVALYCWVSPPSSIVAVLGATSMLEITGLTVSIAVSDLPFAVAVMVTEVGVEPDLTPVARPDELIVATPVLPLSQVKLAPVIATS